MSPQSKIDYPVASKDDSVSDNYHGLEVKDYYRWLEDPDSSETQAFIEKQNNLSKPFNEDCEEWEKLRSKLTKLWNYPKYSCISRHGDRYFFYKNSGLQNQNVLYQQDTLDSEPKVFLDPNTLSDDGTVALTTASFSDDGKYFAYGLTESGSDWVKIKVRSVETQKDYSEVLEKFKFSSIAWTKDNKGFFYGRYPNYTGKADGSETEQSENQKLYYHRTSTILLWTTGKL